MLIFSGTVTFGDCSSSRTFALPSREDPKAIPVPSISLRMGPVLAAAVQHLPVYTRVEALGGERAYPLGPFHGADVQDDRATYRRASRC